MGKSACSSSCCSNGLNDPTQPLLLLLLLLLLLQFQLNSNPPVTPLNARINRTVVSKAITPYHPPRLSLYLQQEGMSVVFLWKGVTRVPSHISRPPSSPNFQLSHSNAHTITQHVQSSTKIPFQLQQEDTSLGLLKKGVLILQSHNYRPPSPSQIL